MGLLLFLLERLPARWARALLRLAAGLAWTLGIRQRVALGHLRLAFPEKTEAERRALARANYRHLGECAADFLRSPGLRDRELLEMVVEPDDWAKVEPWLKAGQGFICCSAHFGNFEMLGVYAARRGAPLTALTRPLKGAANARWVATRALAGIREVHKGMDNLVEAVQRGDVLALLIDQNMLPKRAVFVPFFGQLAATTPAPAVVAERTGAPVFLAFLLRVAEGRYRLLIEGPFVFERKSEDREQDVLAFTAMLNERFERHVREHPEQWFWLHRRWKTRPPGEQTCAAAAPTASHPAAP
ncbi:MAG: lysophospholipid acyltransferase family protein [Deltaproteobacteria bacterium]|nr:lysophospholipid acyltransferase family protein [Deltaproteobacteria bacterium]